MNHLKKLFVVAVVLTLLPGLLRAQDKTSKTDAPAKTLWTGTLDLKKELGKAVTHQNHGTKEEDLWSYRIQAWLMFYAYAMHHSPEAMRMELLNQVQGYVGGIATEDGLRRPKFLAHTSFAKKLPTEAWEKPFVLTFAREENVGYTLYVEPEAQQAAWLPLAALSLLQNTVEEAKPEALRFLAISMGAINKWYREHQASDPKSLSEAPAYALNLAMDVLSKFGASEASEAKPEAK